MRKEAGFSLMEVLVALAITGTMTTAGTLMMSQTLSGTRAVEERLESLRDMSIAEHLIREDLARARIRMSVDPETNQTPASFLGGDISGQGTFLSIVRDGWTNTNTSVPRGDLQKVSYRYEEQSIVRRAWLRPDPSIDTPYVDRTLFVNVEQLDIRYMNDGRWFAGWGTDKIGLHPQMVELNILFGEDDKLPLKLLVGGAQ